MTKIRMIDIEKKMSKKEELQFNIKNLNPDIRGIKRLMYIGRFYYWYLFD